MSIPATNWVWSLGGQSGELPHGLPNATTKLVLMKYADHAHDDGTHTWQSIEKVARYALCSVRTAQRAVAWLVENGYMREGDQSVIPKSVDPRRRPIAYELAMSEQTRMRWAALAGSGGGRRDAAAAAGAKGAEKRAESRGDNVTPQGSTSTPEPDNTTGDNLSPQESASWGDNQSTPGVTETASWGDTGVTQTTQEPSIGTTPSFSSPTADAVADAEPDGDAGVAARNQAPEVTALCEHLRDRIISNGTPEHRVRITKAWRDEARRLLDRDGRDTTKAHNLIDWCQNDTFWRKNILSMPTFREKYDQIRLAALEEWEKKQLTPPTARRNGTPDWGRAAELTAEVDRMMGQGA